MKRKAILIGFEYTYEKLPGISIDLYYVYTFLKNKGWKDDEIIIFTDIDKDYETQILKTAILERIVNSDILSFIEDCKERKQYIRFTHYHNFFSMLDIFVDNVFIYFTGHCKNGNIILPNSSMVSDFTNLIKASSAICIMDCCEYKSELPWILNHNIYRLKDDIEKKDFLKPEIICISSSLENEKTVTSKIGSYYTRYLFEILEKSRSLDQILKMTKNKLKNFKQTVNISASYPNLFYLPAFFYSFNNIKIRIFNDHLILEK